MESLPYPEAEELQKELVAQRKAGAIPDTLLLLEHLAVITLGRASSRQFLLGEPDIPVLESGRGGEITYHGPGQLVAYPILLLEEDRRDLHRYMRDLEEVVIAILQDLQIAGERSPGRTGVWVEERKIASIGVRASSWVTSHGVALNVKDELDGFRWMVPCGLEGVTMTSVTRECAQKVSREQVEGMFRGHFARIFQREVIDYVGNQ